MREYVLDTQILIIANSPLHPTTFQALELLTALHNSHRIALDDSHEIENEYRSNLPRVSHALVWLNKMHMEGKISFHKPILTAAQRQHLDRVGFDPTDRKFVAVACRTHDKLLVAEEKHFWSTHHQACLCQSLGLNLLRIADAATHAGS